MIPEIAVMLNQEGVTTTLTDPGDVVVYSRMQRSWEPARVMPFSLDKTQGIVHIRQKMGELIAFLGECKIFVPREVSGAIFFELEKARIMVWEIHGRPEEFLEQIWLEEEEDNKTKQAGTIEIPVPVETTPGCYFLSIKDIQGKRPEVSSKQILQKFIQKGAFKQIDVICDHVPPWIEMESGPCGFSMESERTGQNEVTVILKKNS